MTDAKHPSMDLPVQSTGIPMACRPSASMAYGRPTAKEEHIHTWDSANSVTGFGTSDTSFHAAASSPCSLDCVLPCGTIVLNLAGSQPKHLEQQQLQTLTVAGFRALLQVYVGKLQCSLAEDGMAGLFAAAQPAEAGSSLAELVREATALGTYVSVCNANLMQEYHRSPIMERNAAAPKSPPWEEVLASLQLSQSQVQALGNRLTVFQQTTTKTASAMDVIANLCQLTPGSWTSTLGAATQLCNVSAQLLQLRERLDHEMQLLNSFTSHTLKSVLTPEQAAHAFIDSFPWYPDMLAVAHLVSGSNGLQKPVPLQSTAHRAASPGPPHLARQRWSEDGAATAVGGGLGPPSPARGNAGSAQVNMGSVPLSPRVGDGWQARSDVVSPLTPALMSHLSQLPTTPNSTGSPISKPNSAEIPRSQPLSDDLSPHGGAAFLGQFESGRTRSEDYRHRSHSLAQTTSEGSGSTARAPSLLDQVASAFRQHQRMDAALFEGQPPSGHNSAEGDNALAGQRVTSPVGNLASAFGSVTNGPLPQTGTSNVQGALQVTPTRPSHREWVRQQVSRAQRVSVNLARTLADLEAQGTQEEDQPCLTLRQSFDEPPEADRHISVSPRRTAPARLLSHRRSGSMGLVDVEAAKAVLDDMRDLRRMRSASLETEVLRDFMESIQGAQQDSFARSEPQGDQDPAEGLHWEGAQRSDLRTLTGPIGQAPPEAPSRQPNLSKPRQSPVFDPFRGSLPAPAESPLPRQMSEAMKRRVSIGEYSFEDSWVGPSPRAPYFAGAGHGAPFPIGGQGRRFSLDVTQQHGTSKLAGDAGAGGNPRAFLNTASAVANRPLSNLHGLLSWAPMLQAASQGGESTPSDISRPGTGSPVGSRSSGRSSPSSPKVNHALVEGVKGIFKGPETAGFAARARPPIPLHGCQSSPSNSLSGVDLWYHGDAEKVELLRPVHSEELHTQEGTRMRSQTTSPSPHALRSTVSLPEQAPQLPANMPTMNGLGKPVSALSHALNARDNGAQEWQREQPPSMYLAPPGGHPPPSPFSAGMQCTPMRVPTHPIGTLTTLTAAGFLTRKQSNRPAGNGNK